MGVKRGQHKIATVSRLTGFSPELLRAWENRHQLLVPSRGPGGQRLYSDEDVTILRGVRALLDQGLTIGEIAAGGRRQLVEAARSANGGSGPIVIGPSVGPAPVRSPGWVGDGGPEVNGSRAMQIAAQAVGRLSARLEPARLMDLVAETLATDFHAALARIWVYDPTDKVLLLRASAGLSRRTAESSRARIDPQRYRYKVGVVARSGVPFLSSNIIGDPQFDQRWVRRERLLAVACLPLSAGDALQGVLAAFFRVALTEEVLGAVGMFASVVSASLGAHRASPRASTILYA
jgi:MerR HTH family regulatory protein/GAF domain